MMNASRRVALLAEGVDRNLFGGKHALAPFVALLAEGVDRNRHIPGTIPIDNRSPSSRRAWIEICIRMIFRPSLPVALLAEGVDRNYVNYNTASNYNGRPPRGGRG